MTSQELDLKVAELLLASGVVAAATVERARAFQQARRCTLVGALLDLHLVQPNTIRPLLGEVTEERAVDPSLMTVYPEFIDQMNQLIPASIVARLCVFPAQAELNAIHVCMVNPTDGRTIRALESLSGCRIEPLVASEPSILRALTEHYGDRIPTTLSYSEGGWDEAAAACDQLLQMPFDTFVTPAMSWINRQRESVAKDPQELESLIRHPAIIRLVQQLLCRAVIAGASDVHVEQEEDSLRVRVRVDGAMKVAHTLPPSAGLPILARLKAMAALPIGQATVPFDGRVTSEIVWGRSVDLRVSVMPCITGEKMVLRVLERSRKRIELADLGMDADSRVAIEVAADAPNGLILVTGPTGSGKTSTLYALLDRANEVDTCILTAEDPVESQLQGVTQVQCTEGSGIAFAAALRSFLRQDPDVIMVGEVRDVETADMALKAALTGHQVFSTLHANDAPGAILRLLNMNIEPFLIASALRLVVAQRLIRRLCRRCRVAGSVVEQRRLGRGHLLPDAIAAALEGVTVFEAGACPECDGTGYRGRTGIFETLKMSTEIEELIIRRDAQQIRVQARLEGMRTLREAALEKVVLGGTLIAEVLEHTVDAMSDAPFTARRMVTHA